MSSEEANSSRSESNERDVYAKRVEEQLSNVYGRKPTAEEVTKYVDKKFPKSEAPTADTDFEKNIKWLRELKENDPARHAELVAKWKADAVEAEKELRNTLDRMDRAVEAFPHLKNDPSAALELYNKVGEKLGADADAARLRIKARRAFKEELASFLGRTVIVEKKGVESSCCTMRLEGTLKAHGDGLGSFVLNMNEGTSGTSFFGFYSSSVMEISIKNGATIPVFLLK